MKVALIFRKANPHFFSIEKIFFQIRACFKGNEILIDSMDLPSGRFNIFSIIRNLFFAGKLRYDVFHVTGHNHYITLALPSKKAILTVHDCGFLFDSKGIKRLVLKWLLFDLPLKKAAIITTVSEKTKAEIIYYSKINPDRVVVIPNPVSNTIYYSNYEFNKLNPVILLIGTKPNKNLVRTFSALKGIACRVRIIGTVTNELEQMAKQCNIIYTSAANINEEEIAQEYAKADMVVFASTYEGFGLPVIEAQKAGRPVLTSNVSPLMEVAGGGACLVDPTDISSIRNGVLKIIENDIYRQHLVNAGTANCKRFEITEIAALYKELYRKIYTSNLNV